MASKPPTVARYLSRYFSLLAGAAAIAYGLLAWQAEDFDFAGLLFWNHGWRLHPLHLLVVGIPLIPATLWDIFHMELDRHADQREP